MHSGELCKPDTGLKFVKDFLKLQLLFFLGVRIIEF